MVNLYKAAVTPPFPRGWPLNTGLTHTLVSQKLDAQLFRHHNIFINILKLVQYGYGLIRFGKNIFIIYRSYVSQRYLSARLNQGLLRKSTRSMLSPLATVPVRLRKRSKFVFLRNILSIPQSRWQLEGFCFQYPWEPSIVPVFCS